MKTADQLYEELRAVIDNGNESMTHEDALEHVRALRGEHTGKFTVLVLRPDYVASGYGDTYLAHVTAGSAEEAQDLAQREVYQSDFPPDEDADDYDDSDCVDYFVLAVFEGCLKDVRVTE